MPSEAELTPPRASWLRSQGLGLLCAQATVLLLGVGSLVLAATRDGASANIVVDDVTAFFRPVSAVHLWFYLLMPVLGLYALNTVLCTWDAVLGKWRRGIRDVSAYAPAVIHVSFGLALLAHGVGGVWNREADPVLLSAPWQAIPDGRQARLLDLRVDTLENGQPRSVEASVEVREADGQVRAATLGYNQPLSSGWGSQMLLLAKAVRIPQGARLTSGGASCVVSEGGVCTLGELKVDVSALHESGHWGEVPVAVVRATEASGASEGFYLMQGEERRLAGGKVLRFEGLETTPAVLVRSRFAPGNPWALGSVLVLSMGLLLMGRRWL